MTAIWSVLAAIGALAFILGAVSGDPSRAWSIYLVNLVFWSALAVTGPAIAGMMQLTEARWSPSVRRIALTTIGFLPAAFVLLVILVAAGQNLYPWMANPGLAEGKAMWLNPAFFMLRTLGLAAALFTTCYAFARALLRDEVPPGNAIDRARRNRLAVTVLFLWIITVSLWGFDLVMSIDPKWYSGLFGGYFCVTALYTTFCLLSIMTIRANARGIASIPPAAVQDVAKLQFAMSVFWMYFFFSQYLVIWYGNVPVETRFFVRRFFVQPWLTLTWVIWVVGWLIPFGYLLKRLTGRPPQRHGPLVVVAVFGLVAIFLERVLIILPSVSPALGLPVGVQDLAITVGFLALFVLGRRWFMARFKPVLNLPHTGVH